MEGTSVSLYRTMRSYWRRRGYRRLSDSGWRRRAGSDQDPTRRRWRNRRSFWRVRIAPRLKLLRLATSSPKKLFVWLRDAYVRMMLGFANSGLVGDGYGLEYGAAVANVGIAAFGRVPPKEYDQRVLVEIYKSVLMEQALGPLASRGAVAGNPSSEITSGRRSDGSHL